MSVETYRFKDNFKHIFENNVVLNKKINRNACIEK